MKAAKKNLVVFGYGLGIIALVFGLMSLHKHGMSWSVATLLVCSPVFMGVTFFNYEALKPGYLGWMRVATLIGSCVTAVVLGIVYFIIFTPIGLLLRLAKKDHLQRNFEKEEKTYWHQRLTEDTSKERYCKQF